MDLRPSSNKQYEQTPERRREEADSLIEMIQSAVGGYNAYQLTPKELGFIKSMESYDGPISPAQLFWLRDIKDKLLA